MSSQRRVSRPSNGRKNPRKSSNRQAWVQKKSTENRLLSPNQIIRAKDNQIYEIVQATEVLAATVSSSSVPIFSNYVTEFAQLDQYAALAAVFDQYRIVEIEYTAVPRLQTLDGTVTNAGFFHSVVDYDDGTNLSTVAQALDYQNVLVTSGNKVHKRTFKPRVAVAAYSGAFTSYANMENQWIDCTSPNVNYFGIKTAWTVTSTPLYMDVIIRMRVQFRNVR
jgi:hypothetical protein